MKEPTIDARSQRMLELLATGAGSRQIAKEMGYQEGTMRVYLHNLYRKLGVANKTEAVVWFLRRAGHPADISAGATAAASRPAAAPRRGSEDLFGDMALAEGLYAALGVMGAFVGPFSRAWEVSSRLAGDAPDPAKDGQRARARSLWNALLAGDFGHAKAIHDADEGVTVWMDSISDAVLLVALLALGGYSNAARQFAARLTDRRRSYGHLTPRDATLLRTLFEAIDGDEAAMGRLARTAEGAGPAAPRQLAMALLFHVHRLRKDAERARQVANALWADAESARKELQLMGDRSLGSTRQVAAPATRGAVREKVAAR